MRLYKYKSSEQLLHLLDIVLHERLYCPQYRDLNDPFEGQFRTLVNRSAIQNLGFPAGGRAQASAGIRYSSVEELVIGGGTRVCSLSSTYNDVVMWSLYAQGHTGAVVEIDFAGIESSAHQVSYDPDLPKLSNNLLTGASTVDALTWKTTDWAREQEWRIIGEEDYFDVRGRVTRILLGVRASETFVSTLTKVAPTHISVHRMDLDFAGVRVIAGARLNEFPHAD